MREKDVGYTPFFVFFFVGSTSFSSTPNALQQPKLILFTKLIFSALRPMRLVGFSSGFDLNSTSYILIDS